MKAVIYLIGFREQIAASFLVSSASRWRQWASLLLWCSSYFWCRPAYLLDMLNLERRWPVLPASTDLYLMCFREVSNEWHRTILRAASLSLAFESSFSTGTDSVCPIPNIFSLSYFIRSLLEWWMTKIYIHANLILARHKGSLLSSSAVVDDVLGVCSKPCTKMLGKRKLLPRVQSRSNPLFCVSIIYWVTYMTAVVTKQNT